MLRHSLADSGCEPHAIAGRIGEFACGCARVTREKDVSVLVDREGKKTRYCVGTKLMRPIVWKAITHAILFQSIYINSLLTCRHKHRQHDARNSEIARVFIVLRVQFLGFLSIIFRGRIWLQRGRQAESIISRDLLGQYRCVHTSVDGRYPGIM